MINKLDIFNIRFYAKSKFHGSYKGMHYRIEKIVLEDDSKKLQVTTWPGPYNFDNTDDELKVCEIFPFSDEGLAEVCDYLNAYHSEHYA